MTELNTLKDLEDVERDRGFEESCYHPDTCYKEDLKQEAIKWVKEWKNDERLSYPTATIDINAPLALIQLELETKIKTFKHFFNITEEDLK